jgi:coatomer protein complex subunit epsilon
MSDPSSKEIAILQLQEWLGDAAAASNTSLSLIAAVLYILDDNLNEAIRLMHQGINMEQNALLVQLYLRIDRLDLAQKQVKVMKSADEDCTLSMLASAWVNLGMGGAKGAQDAAYIYEELIDKYGGSALLLNGLSVAKMNQGQFEEAETHLQEALTKAPSDPDSLANLIAVSQHLERSPEVVNRYISQLKTKAPNHALLTSLATFESAFDRVSASLKV